MTQTTSVNANNSLILRRASGLPTGAFTVTLQGRFAEWSGNANQNVILIEGPGGQGQIYANLASGEILVWTGASGSTLYSATPSTTAWGFPFIRRSGVGQPWRYGYVSGGVVYEVVGTDLGNPSDAQILGLTFAGSNQANQLHACSWGIFAGYYSDAELIAQAVADSPIASAHTTNGWVPMSSAATVGTASIGTSATVVGTGADVTDSPYLVPHDLGASGLSAGIPTLGTPALGQTHALAATGLTAGVPLLGTPSLSQLGEITPRIRLRATVLTPDITVTVACPAIVVTVESAEQHLRVS